MVQKRNRDELILAAGRKPEEQAYWLEQFAGMAAAAVFPYDMPDTGVMGDYSEFSFQMDNAVAAGIKKMAGGSDVRLHLVLTSLVTVLAGQYGNTGDVTIGTPIFSGGKDDGLINTMLPLRVRTEARMSFKDLVLMVRDRTVRATEHQNFPMEILSETLGVPWLDRRFPLFDIAVVVTGIQELEVITAKYKPFF